MTRNLRGNQSGEDYLESILLLSEQTGFVHRVEIAKKMDVSQAAVNKAMKLLQQNGYVYEDGKHLYLTETGKTYAQKIFDRHCIIRAFIQSMGVSAKTAEEDACRMEHLISEETFLAMKKNLEKEDWLG